MNKDMLGVVLYYILCYIYMGTGRNILRGLTEKVTFEQILEKYQWK